MCGWVLLPELPHAPSTSPAATAAPGTTRTEPCRRCATRTKGPPGPRATTTWLPATAPGPPRTRPRWAVPRQPAPTEGQVEHHRRSAVAEVVAVPHGPHSARPRRGQDGGRFPADGSAGARGSVLRRHGGREPVGHRDDEAAEHEGRDRSCERRR